MNESSVDEILDFAITSEAGAYQFYKELATKMQSQAMRQVFEDFAKEELSHKAKLEKIKNNKSVTFAKTKEVADLKISDYVVDVEPRPDMDYQDALVLAMKAEKMAYKLYSDLASTATDQSIRELFLALAQEEARHKLRFEIEYDQEIMKEN